MAAIDREDLIKAPHFAARENVVSVTDPDLGEVKTHGPVLKYSRTPGEVTHLGPEPGAHNEEVYLEEVSLDEETCRDLAEKQVI